MTNSEHDHPAQDECWAGCPRHEQILGVLTGQVPVKSMPITGRPPRQELDGEMLPDEPDEDGSE